MKKIALLLALSVFAAAPAAAAAKKKSPPKPQQMTYDEAMAYNKRNLSLVVQALPLVLPTWSLPIYFSMDKPADAPKHGKKKKKH